MPNEFRFDDLDLREEPSGAIPDGSYPQLTKIVSAHCTNTEECTQTCTDVCC